MDSSAAVDWSQIDTVLLDMDGTLLDLRFDNWFWQELIPNQYALANGMSFDAAVQVLRSKFHATRGTLQWYCIEHWTRQLGLDIVALKRAELLRIGYLPGAEGFLHRLKVSGKRRVLVTNAHPATLVIKDQQVGLIAHFDACYSTHAFHLPKETVEFWPRLQAVEPFVAQRTLFIDDSLAVLNAAHGFGITWLRAIRRPDSGLPAQATGAFAAVDQVADLL